MTKALELLTNANSGLRSTLDSDRGQGTVEYVGIVFIVAAIVIAVIAASATFGSDIMNAIGNAIKTAIESIG